MNIVKESMNRPFGYLGSATALLVPPVLSIAVTLFLERFTGTLVCIIIFPIVYILSLLVTLCGMTYLTNIFEGTGKHNKEAALEDRIRQLELLVVKLTLENEFLKKAVQRDHLTPAKKNGSLVPNNVTYLKTRKGSASS